MRIRAKLAAGAGILVVLGGGLAYSGFALAASNAVAPLTGTIYACVNNSGQIAWLEMSNPGHPCASNLNLEHWNVTGPAGVKGATGATGPQGPAGTSYQPDTVTSVVSITNDPDSSSHGTWATDTITRTFTIVRHSAAPLADCSDAPSGNATCYYYTGTVADNGTFVTTAGAKSPNAGVTVNGILNGNLVGGTHVEFYADSDALQASSLSVVNNSADTYDGTSSPLWYQSFFPAGSVVSGVNLPDWSWTYSAPNTCEQWVDAYNNNGGSGATDGDITGVNNCTA
jgi:hypothetical protein